MINPTELIECLSKDKWHVSGVDIQNAINLIESLVAERDGWKSEALEESRLNGMGAEREAKLMTRLDSAHVALNALMTMDVRGHQLQDRLRFSVEGRRIFDLATKALQEGE